MRLVTFTRQGGTGHDRAEQDRVGALVGTGHDRVLDLARVVPGLPDTLAGVLAGGPAALDRLRPAVERADMDTDTGTDLDADALLPLSAVRLRPPVPAPGKVLCIGYNYRGHAAAGSVEDPEYPDVFAKTVNTIVGPDEAIVLPRASREVDYEAELAVIIGARGRDIPLEEAMAHVGGYTLFDDVSARDWQRHGSQWVLGKSFDTFGPLGPALVTPDEVPDPGDLTVELRVNGEVTVRSTTAVMIFTVPYLVSYLSQVVTLEPGDVIATGTPQKLPEVLERGPRWLRAGDVVEITIGHLGTLRSPVAAGPAPAVES